MLFLIGTIRYSFIGVQFLINKIDYFQVYIKIIHLNFLWLILHQSKFQKILECVVHSA